MKKISTVKAILRSAVFNFKYLPLCQAIKLPILIYKGRIINKGKIIINGNAKFGMIRLGFNVVSLFPNNGITLENRGNIIFNGNLLIGNNSSISVNETGILEFGNQFSSSTGLKIACYDSIKIGQRVRFGWNVIILDTSFHALTNQESGKVYREGYAPILIGNDVWIANGCKLYKGVSIPPFCVVGADTILHKPVVCPKYTLITNKHEVSIKTNGLYRNIDDDNLDFYLKYKKTNG